MQNNDHHLNWFETLVEPEVTPAPAGLSLFSGCGGFCEGIERAGFEVKTAIEIDPHASLTYRHNFPEVPLFEGDVRTFMAPSPDAHIEKYGLSEIDLVFGGPPCQGFSQIGPRKLDDERNTLYREYLRIVSVLRPRLFLMENVPNLVLLNKGHFRDIILRDFKKIGYSDVTYLKVCASDYGAPQDRNRVIFIGTRDEDAFPFDLATFAEDFLDKLRMPMPFNVWDGIGDLPASVVPSGKTMPYAKLKKPASLFQKLMRLDYDCGIYPKAVKKQRGVSKMDFALHNHHTKEIQARRIELISHLKPGFKGDSLPKEIWNGLRPEKWRRLHAEKPAYTILAQMHRDLSEWVHPKLERWITVREAARLQSFHDGFVFVGSEWQQLKQIGNAVPPLLAAALGKLALAVIEKIQNDRCASPRPVVFGKALVLHENGRKTELAGKETSKSKKPVLK